jgi:hypothetical protein
MNCKECERDGGEKKKRNKFTACIISDTSTYAIIKMGSNTA